MNREEAIEIIKNATVWNDEERAALAILIPELRESEDERIRKWLVDYFGSIKETVWIPRDITCEQILAWLEKQKEQKPAEWEDIKDKVNIPYCSSEPEWSEEDERMFNLVIECIEREERDETITRSEAKKIFSMLKSLRPQPKRNCKDCAMFLNGKCTKPRWKPSEEHLSALLAIFNDPDNIGSQTCQLALTDLYEHLKKLMED